MILEAAKNPQSNLPAALLFYALVFCLLLLLIVLIILVFLSGRKRKAVRFAYVVRDEDGNVTQAIAVDKDQENAILGQKQRKQKEQGPNNKSVPSEAASPKLFRVSAGLTVVMGVILILIVGNIATQSRDVCSTCHDVSKHGSVVVSGEHARVSCVSCHESGNLFQRSIGDTIGRGTHVVGELLGFKDPGSTYGVVQSSSCIRCHKDIPAQQALPEGSRKAQLLNMSHKEPVAAGMDCIQCHPQYSMPTDARALADQRMTLCLKCHNGNQAAADCTTCHRKDPASQVILDNSKDHAGALPLR